MIQLEIGGANAQHIRNAGHDHVDYHLLWSTQTQQSSHAHTLSPALDGSGLARQ